LCGLLSNGVWRLAVTQVQWTLELRPAWHKNNLGYDQNFSFDLRPNLELLPACRSRPLELRPAWCS
jgi:hypothetical protein